MWRGDVTGTAAVADRLVPEARSLCAALVALPFCLSLGNI